MMGELKMDGEGFGLVNRDLWVKKGKGVWWKVKMGEKKWIMREVDKWVGEEEKSLEDNFR